MVDVKISGKISKLLTREVKTKKTTKEQGQIIVDSLDSPEKVIITGSVFLVEGFNVDDTVDIIIKRNQLTLAEAITGERDKEKNDVKIEDKPKRIPLRRKK